MYDELSDKMSLYHHNDKIWNNIRERKVILYAYIHREKLYRYFQWDLYYFCIYYLTVFLANII